MSAKDPNELKEMIQHLEEFDEVVNLRNYPISARLMLHNGPELFLDHGMFPDPGSLDGLQSGIFTDMYLKCLTDYRTALVERINNFKVE